MASFRCYDNSDVIATLVITNFHLCLTELWWQFFFVYGDVVYIMLKFRGIDPERLDRATLSLEREKKDALFIWFKITESVIYNV